MNVNKKENLKEKFIEMYLDGKTIIEISQIMNYSRNFIGRTIKDDERVINYRNTKTLKVIKYKNNNKMMVPITTSLLEQIGISKDRQHDDYVDVKLDNNSNTIIIKKHN